MRRALGLTRHSRFEDAMRAGERFVSEFGLGDAPATRLSEAMERELAILVLMVDADRDISDPAIERGGGGAAGDVLGAVVAAGRARRAEARGGSRVAHGGTSPQRARWTRCLPPGSPSRSWR